MLTGKGQAEMTLMFVIHLINISFKKTNPHENTERVILIQYEMSVE